MAMNRRGFAPIAIVLLVVVGLAVLGGGFYYFSHRSQPVTGPLALPLTQQHPAPIPTTPAPTSTPSSTPVTPVPSTQNSPLYPMSGPIGATVTITGSGFAATGNVVTMNGLSAGSLKNLSSADGKTIVFIVPQTLGPVCNKSEMCAQFLMDVTPGTAYTVAVLAADGSSSQAIGTFTVTGDSQGHLPL